MATKQEQTIHMTEKVKAKLTETFGEYVENREYLWKEGAAKREGLSRMMLKLIKDDPEMDRLMKEAREKTLALAQRPLPKHRVPMRVRERKTDTETRIAASTDNDDGINTEDFAPTSIHLSPPWANAWTSNTNTDLVVVEPEDGEMRLSLNTESGYGHTQSAAMAMGPWFQPLPGSGQMTVSVNAFIAYSYGNHAWAQSAETHAWIGIYIVEWDPDTQQEVQVNSRYAVDLWNYTHDSDLGSSEDYPVAVTVATVPEHVYAVLLWAGGDVSSTGLSYASLSVSMTDMFIRLA